MSKTIAEPFSVDEERKDVIHKGRNTLTLARWQDKDVVVKDFGRPLLRGWEYALRKSKARRSFENARTLLQRGIDTPAPIAYRERRSDLTNRLKGCAYICLYEPSQSLLDFYDTADAAFIHAFAAFVAGLHDKGIRHDDLNNTNIRVTASDGGYRFSLIDLNRMHIYPEGQAVPVDECFDNITRFSCLDDTFVAFLDQYLELRGLPSSLRDKALEIKRRHDANTDRKKKLKRLI
ncbi:MAG: lipopolysaccharide kinase InaA family protein [Bacteroidales bacterium]|nr:lipopolysaccharide kinase InaA family protein [Bacteroidales bacterium]